jgi:hypothetical protein
MSFFTPKPVFDFLTGTDDKNCMPWEGRANANLTRNTWSAPYPLIFTGDAPGVVEDQSRGIIADPQFLVLGISPATCAIGPTGVEVWSLTVIVQRKQT